MSTTALHIIEDFLKASDAGVRRKGVIALRALQTADAASRLVHVALGDIDPATRERAEESIVALALLQGALTDQALQKHLDRKEDERATYALLGRLELRGYRGGVALGTLSARLRRAFGLFSEVRRGFSVSNAARKGWRFWIRGFWPAVQGMLLGCLVLLFVFLEMEFLDDLAKKDDVLGVLFVVFSSVVVSVRATPTRLHFDRFAGVAVDVLFMSATLLILCLLLALSDTSRFGSFGLALLVATLIAVIRVVVAITNDAITIPFVGAFIHVCAAAFAGIFSVGILLWGWTLITATTVNEIGVWASCWLLAFALARSFVALDRLPNAPARADPSRKLSRVVLAWICGVTIAVLLLVVLSPLFQETGDQAKQVVEMRLGDKPETRFVSEVPVGYELKVTKPQQQLLKQVLITVKVAHVQEGPRVRVRVQIHDADAVATKDRLASKILDGSPRMDFVLRADDDSKLSARTIPFGEYWLRVGLDLENSTLLAEFHERLSKLFRRSGSRAKLKLIVSLEPPPE